ncbi:hypothetical protein CDL12_14224 [Handroanthus impetiginosus]|uniref:Uncharacterized protein n=1 Tax=Handroanthus impetiginosus TaxID=429701 RepID=A0A2G9H6K4_9LAMI|nr:hypothetical protein CDL12_14224 [Handroanthus impetiginosus]
MGANLEDAFIIEYLQPDTSTRGAWKRIISNNFFIVIFSAFICQGGSFIFIFHASHCTVDFIVKYSRKLCCRKISIY